MSVNLEWTFVEATYEGMSFSLDGIDVWKHLWVDTKNRVQVEDPRYHQKFTFHIYEVNHSGKTVQFAAGEFSNGVWGFYTSTPASRK